MESMPKQESPFQKFEITYPEGLEYRPWIMETLLRTYRHGDTLHIPKEFVKRFYDHIARNPSERLLDIVAPLRILDVEPDSAIVKDIYDQLSNEREFEKIIRNRDFFRKYSITIDAQDILYSPDSITILDNIEFFDEEEVSVNFGKIFDELEVRGFLDDILDHVDLFRRRGVEVDAHTLATLLRSSSQEYMIIQYIDFFEREGVSVDIQGIYGRLIQSRSVELLIHLAPIFESKGIDIDAKRIYEEMYTQAKTESFNTLLENAEFFIKRGVHVNATEIYAHLKEHKEALLIERYLSFFLRNSVEVDIRVVYNLAILGERWEFVAANLSVWLEHGISLDEIYNKMRSDNREWRFYVRPIIIANKKLVSNDELNQIFSYRPRAYIDPEWRHLQKGTFNPNKERSNVRREIIDESIELESLIGIFYFYDLVMRSVSEIRVSDMSDNALVFTQKVKTYYEQIKRHLHEYLKIYLIIAITSELAHQDIGYGNLPSLCSDPNFIFDRYSNEDILCFLKSAAFRFNDGAVFTHGSNFGGKPWSQIARAAYDLWSEVKPSTQVLDHVIDLEHNNGTFFDKDPRVSRHSSELTLQRVLEAKKHASTMSIFIDQMSKAGIDQKVITGMRNIHRDMQKMRIQEKA